MTGNPSTPSRGRVGERLLRIVEVREEVEKMSPLLEKVLLATDGSEDAKLAAQAAANLSDKTGAELHVVHA